MPRPLLWLCLLLLLASAGCGLFGSSPEEPVAPPPAAEAPEAQAAPHAQAVPSGAVVLQADSFLFKPNLIRVKAGGTLTLAVTNVDESPHEIVVKNPAGEEVASAELPPHEQVTVRVPLPTPGDYPFECPQPFHAKLGMAGRIVAE